MLAGVDGMRRCGVRRVWGWCSGSLVGLLWIGESGGWESGGMREVGGLVVGRWTDDDVGCYGGGGRERT